MAERLCPISFQSHIHCHNPALITAQRIWTYQECDTIIQNLCSHLKAMGIAHKERVAFVAYTTASSIFLLFALFRLGATACPLSFREPLDKITQLLDVLDAAHYLQTDKLPIASSTTHSFSTIEDAHIATHLFTSGSSGTPKIACHTLNNYLYSALGVESFFSLNTSSRWLLSLPLFHVGGLSILFRVFLSGGAVILSDLSLDALRTHQVTHISMVPTQLFRLLKEKQLKEATKHLRCLLLGGAPIPSLIYKEALYHRLPLITTYGMTEMSSLITAAKMPLTEHLGQVLPFRRLSISGQNEILVKGETLFSGYWDKKQGIVSYCIDGWFPTHDLGEFTLQGNLRILGRADRLFISGGENIHPEEIECALCSIQGILSATVLAISDPEFGQRPIAFIQDETSAHSLESIRKALEPLLPSFKHPIRIFPYPKNVKVLK